MSKEVYNFYKSRLAFAPLYGMNGGHQIIKAVTRCAFWDSYLTADEFNSIIILAEQAHIKLMEENYNAGWDK